MMFIVRQDYILFTTIRIILLIYLLTFLHFTNNLLFNHIILNIINIIQMFSLINDYKCVIVNYLNRIYYNNINTLQ